MKKILYTIKDPAGIHARPAGMLVKEAKKYDSRIQLQKGDRKASATNLIAIMGMGLRCGDQVEISIEGPDEDAAKEGLQAFLDTMA
nr:HPr family phosphocarrier protein [uncultured Blautia sp.]